MFSVATESLTILSVIPAFSLSLFLSFSLFSFFFFWRCAVNHTRRVLNQTGYIAEAHRQRGCRDRLHPHDLQSCPCRGRVSRFLLLYIVSQLSVVKHLSLNICGAKMLSVHNMTGGMQSSSTV